MKSITKSLTFDEVRRMGYHEILDALGVRIGEYVSDRRIEPMSREVELMTEVKEKLRDGGGEYPLDFIYKINLIAMVDCLKVRERTEYKYFYEFTGCSRTRRSTSRRCISRGRVL